MLVGSDGFCEAVKELLHRFRIGIGHDERKGIVCPWFDSGKDVGEGETLIAKSWRALPSFPPNVAGTALLPDTRFVLEKQANALITVRMLNYFQQQRGSF